MPGKKKIDLSPTSERLELAKAISNLSNKQDQFVNAVATLQEFKSSTLQNLDLEIESRKIDLEELEKNICKVKKDGEIETTQYITEFRYEAAKKILEENGEQPINIEEHKCLLNMIEELKGNHAKQLDELKSKERDSAKKQLNSAISNAELTHKADIATLSAENKQMEHEIKNLKDVISNLRTELSAQRQLTKDVADASRSSEPRYIKMGTN